MRPQSLPHAADFPPQEILQDHAGPTVDDALAYLAQGVSVIPLWQGTKRSALAKGRIQRYRQHLTTRDELQHWFSGRQPNIGLLTGRPSQLLVLDLDGEAGRAFLRGQAVPLTPMVETPSDGLHVYFRMPDLASIPWKTHIGACGLAGVDLLGNDHYVVAPPSLLTPYEKRGRTYPGGRYTFGDFWDLASLRADLADPPPWLLDLWRAADHTTAPRERGRPAGSEASSEYSGLASLGRVGMAELAKDAEAEWRCAQFLGLSKAPEDVGRPFHCVLPGHEEAQPSASLYRGANSSLMYRDWHQRSGRSWYLLPEVYASMRMGEVARLPAPSLAVWRIRLWFAAGIVARPTVPLPPLPEHAPASVRQVYEGFGLLVACKWTYEPGTPTMFSWRFAAGWCGVSERIAGEAIACLLRHGVIRHAGTYRRAAVFLPGTRPR